MQRLLATVTLVLASALCTAQEPVAPPAAQPPIDRAWEQASPYRAPDFEAFFPDDAEGGAALDALVKANQLRALGDAEFLAAVRRGLRRTTQYRTNILRDLGNRFVWNKSPQDPDAIELCYHAADFREQAARYGTRHYAVYFGLSVVTVKSPAILRTLADLCVAIDDPNDIGRVAWGAAIQRDELLPYLDPYLGSDDDYVRTKAQAVRSILLGELEAFAWGAERATQPPRPRPRVDQPEVRAALRDGDSAARSAMLARIRAEDLTRLMDDSDLADFALAADDPDPRVRTLVATTVGEAWIWRAGLHRISDAAVALVLRLSHDPDPEVRQQAVYYGLSTCHGDDDAVPRRMLEMLMDPAEARSHDRLLWGLEKYESSAARLLEEDLRGGDAARARAAYHLYGRLFDEAPSVVPAGIAQPEDLAGTWQVTVVAPDGARRVSGIVLEVARADDGSLSLGVPGARESIGGTLADLLCTAVDDVLHVQCSFPVESAVLRSSARLEGDALSGTTRVDGVDTLFVWTAERVPPR